MLAKQCEATLHRLLVCGGINKSFLAALFFFVSPNRQVLDRVLRWPAPSCLKNNLGLYSVGLIFIVLPIISFCYDKVW